MLWKLRRCSTRHIVSTYSLSAAARLSKKAVGDTAWPATMRLDQRLDGDRDQQSLPAARRSAGRRSAADTRHRMPYSMPTLVGEDRIADVAPPFARDAHGATRRPKAFAGLADAQRPPARPPRPASASAERRSPDRRSLPKARKAGRRQFRPRQDETLHHRGAGLLGEFQLPALLDALRRRCGCPASRTSPPWSSSSAKPAPDSISCVIQCASNLTMSGRSSSMRWMSESSAP